MIRHENTGLESILLDLIGSLDEKRPVPADFCRCMTAQTTAAQLLGTAMGAAVGPFLGSNLYAIMWKAQKKHAKW